MVWVAWVRRAACMGDGCAGACAHLPDPPLWAGVPLPPPLRLPLLLLLPLPLLLPRVSPPTGVEARLPSLDPAPAPPPRKGGGLAALRGAQLALAAGQGQRALAARAVRLPPETKAMEMD